MTSLFPFRSEPEIENREPKLVDFETDEADEVFDALGSKTARRLLLELHEEPRPASELAETVDTSVQNVQYHLRKLEAAGLVEAVDTWYSESGTEMTVYAPADRALVLFAGDDQEGALRRILDRLAGAVGVLALGTVVLVVALGGDNSPFGAPANASAPVGGSGGDPLITGLIFFVGGITVLGLLVLFDRVFS